MSNNELIENMLVQRRNILCIGEYDVGLFKDLLFPKLKLEAEWNSKPVLTIAPVENAPKDICCTDYKGGKMVFVDSSELTNATISFMKIKVSRDVDEQAQQFEDYKKNFNPYKILYFKKEPFSASDVTFLLKDVLKENQELSQSAVVLVYGDRHHGSSDKDTAEESVKCAVKDFKKEKICAHTMNLRSSDCAFDLLQALSTEPSNRIEDYLSDMKKDFEKAHSFLMNKDFYDLFFKGYVIGALNAKTINEEILKNTEKFFDKTGLKNAVKYFPENYQTTLLDAIMKLRAKYPLKTGNCEAFGKAYGDYIKNFIEKQIKLIL